MGREDDIKRLAEVVINSWEDHNTDSSYACNHCCGRYGATVGVRIFENFPHEVNCPVFIAQDILTD